MMLMIPGGWSRMWARLPIVRLWRTHRDERAVSERERESLKAEQHELSRRMHVIGWLADVRAAEHRRKAETGGSSS